MPEFKLKDWYGKEKVFDHETIYVRGTNDELLPFTAGEGAVLTELEATANGTYVPDEGVDGFNSVTVAVPETTPKINPLTVTENGTFTAPGNGGVVGYSPVTVNVTPKLQSKTITENGEYTADSGFDGLASVLVNVAGGGGGSFVYTSGQFSAAGNTHTLEHGLGVKPAIFFTTVISRQTTGGKLISACGISPEFAAKIGGTQYGSYNSYTYMSGSLYVYGSRSAEFIDTVAEYPTGVLYKANENTITIGIQNKYLNSGSSYYWFAIGIVE